MKALLVIYTDPAWHPPFFLTSQTLCERGVAVEILFRRPAPSWDFTGLNSGKLGSRVRLRPVGQGSVGWRDKANYAAFLKHAFTSAREAKPDVIIGYDLYGFAGACSAALGSPGAKLVYHNFDITPWRGAGALARLLKRIEYAGARRADCVVFSSRGRASLFKEEARLSKEPLVVMNCQKLSSPVQKTGELDQILRSRGLAFDRLVVRLGSLGPGQGIDATIRSIPEWKGRWGLILAGVSTPAYLGEIQRLVESLDLGNRVVILPSVPDPLWHDCLYAADLGIALYEPGNINHQYMAGAANKLNLYLKAGIPSIVPDIPDFVALVDKFGIGRVADSKDPRSIANAINATFGCQDRYDEHCRNARHAFTAEFNFERQFEPVLRRCVPDVGKDEWQQ